MRFSMMCDISDDFNRVVLESKPGDDYINASYIDVSTTSHHSYSLPGTRFVFKDGPLEDVPVH